MSTQEIVTYILGGLGALVLFFGKLYVENLGNRITTLESTVGKMGDVYLKRDEFKDFKSELWSRLDRMETAVEARLDTVLKAYTLKDFKEL